LAGFFMREFALLGSIVVNASSAKEINGLSSCVIV